MGTPFKKEDCNRYSLDTKDFAHPIATEVIVIHLKRGQLHYHEFLARLEKRVSSQQSDEEQQSGLLLTGANVFSHLKTEGLARRLSFLFQAFHLLPEQGCDL